LTFDELLEEASAEGLNVDKADLVAHDGLICDNSIYLRKDIQSMAERACVLAEEIGHRKKNVGNIIDQSQTDNRKQELKARYWSYDKMVGLIGIINAFNYGCRNRYEMAKYLDVTEDFLQEALDAYKDKYGCDVKIDNYLIRFIPYLSVVKIF
jgi:hypothetical protein